MDLEIQHFAHPEHPLILVNLRDTEIQGRVVTQKQINGEERAKSKSICGKIYHDDVEGKIYYGDMENEDNDSIYCILCDSKMLDSAYSCISCDVHLHMLCGKLPSEMMHPNHKHPLTLMKRTAPRLYPNANIGCDICEDRALRFSYCCLSCDFDVDVRCASKAQSIKHEGHEHPLQPLLSTALFKCYACTREHSPGVSYKCRTCAFWVHEECATLPSTLKYNRHVHPLCLSDKHIQISSVGRCKICHRDVSNRRHWEWYYRCKVCPHEVHVNCLAASLIAERGKTYEVDGDIDLNKVFHLPESFQYRDLICQMIKHTIAHYFQHEQIAAISQVDGPLVSHFSHQHPLTLTIWNAPTNNNHKGDEMKEKNDDIGIIFCNACVLPISTPQVYYSCSISNNYFLHEWCAKLPRVWHHPANPKIALTLGRDPADGEGDVIAPCRSCRCFTEGYVYRGKYQTSYYPLYEYEMDMKCMLLPPAILHKAHQHPLKLIPNCKHEGCVACPRAKEDELAYGCKQCCFYLHSTCALQPITIVHKYDKHHPFTLIYAPLDEVGLGDEYVCEFCEKHINPKWWFYHCFLCDLSACVGCIFEGRGKKCFVNPSIRYSTETHHHPLSYVPVDNSNRSSLCSACHKDIFQSRYPYTSSERCALRCVQCNILFHDREECRVFRPSLQRETS